MLNWTQTSGKNQNNYGDVNDHITKQRSLLKSIFTFAIIQTVCYFKKLNGQREAIDAKPADETIAYWYHLTAFV